MNERDENRFRPRPRPPRAKGGARGQRFLARVLGEVSRAGGTSGAAPTRLGRQTRTRLGRGQVAARFAGSALGPNARRVVIKTRLVVLKPAGSGAVSTHLRYIARDGVTRDGRPAHAYGALTDTADLKEFEARGRKDRHQFRFIVAPEDATELGDLRGFTRDLLQRMEADLGTQLEWVAVDHWDTDNPHTHVVLRGKNETGRDLVIARDYIGHGVRHRASELATVWLGPRTELEIRASMQREVDLERWTGLDQALQAHSRDGVIDLQTEAGDVPTRYPRSLLIGRLQRLAAMGIAQERAPGRWHLRPDAEQTLRALAERGDIVRTMQRAFAVEQRELAIFDATTATRPVVGRVAAKGLADELHDRTYVIVDGVDGRAHYVALPVGTDLGELPVGGIVGARVATERAADRNIAALAENGLYRTDRHLTHLRARPTAGRDAEAIVAAHVRRLEALRRAGVVERLDEGIWRVPEDLTARGRAHDGQRLREAPVELRSHLPIEKQVHAVGATWLDRQLVGEERSLANQGFAITVHEALKAREEFLVGQGLAERRGQRVILARNLLATLRDRDVETTAATLAAEVGLMHRPVVDGGRAAGVYRRSLMLVSGRFALLDDGLGFSLVSWHPVIEKHFGQTLSATVRGNHVAWEVGRQRGRSLG
jgi:type IV secretory pathway VirD2 relaxase